MAKPKHVPPTDNARPSTSSCTAPSPPSKPARRRRKQPARQRSRPLAPSAALLSFLATVAPVAEGSPVPLTFLCPSLESTTPTPVQTKAKRAPTPPSTSTTDPSFTTRLQHPRAVFSNIPYKFTQGDDGVWRKEEEYHLYGVCAGCDSVLDGQISKANSSMPSNNFKAEIERNLPPGWNLPIKKNTHTMLILAISLVLAFFISFLIIGCLFWRKSMRWKNKDKDVEKRRRRRRRSSTELTAESIREIQNDKEAMLKQRLWARATARWRANARHSARQRRGKRIAPSLRSRQSNPSISYVEDDRSSASSSPPATPTLSRSRRSSTSSFHQEPEPDPTPPAPVENTPIPSIVISNPQPATSPPAYQQKSNVSQAESSEGLYPSLSRRPSSASLMRHPSQSASCLSSCEETPSTPALAVAHVATDDKNVLARLAELASAPPTAHETTSEPEVSVPEWQDEQMEDFIAQQQQEQGQQPSLSEDSPNCSIPSSPFPAPPSKGNLLSSDFYDYPYSFEDMTGSEPVYGPCAPPFEETPSAPLMDEETMEVVPSAPPLIDDDDLYAAEQIPSAPLPEGETPTVSTESCTDGAQDASVPSAPREDHDAESIPAALSTGGEEPRGVLPVYRP